MAICPKTKFSPNFHRFLIFSSFSSVAFCNFFFYVKRQKSPQFMQLIAHTPAVLNITHHTHSFGLTHSLVVLVLRGASIGQLLHTTLSIDKIDTLKLGVVCARSFFVHSLYVCLFCRPDFSLSPHQSIHNVSLS